MLPLSRPTDSFRRLADQHVLVLRSDGTEIWMAMPFSALASEWYSRRSQRGWERLALEEAQRVLSDVGLKAEFWNLTRLGAPAP